MVKSSVDNCELLCYYIHRIHTGFANYRPDRDIRRYLYEKVYLRQGHHHARVSPIFLRQRGHSKESLGLPFPKESGERSFTTFPPLFLSLTKSNSAVFLNSTTRGLHLQKSQRLVVVLNPRSESSFPSTGTSLIPLTRPKRLITLFAE